MLQTLRYLALRYASLTALPVVVAMMTSYSITHRCQTEMCHVHITFPFWCGLDLVVHHRGLDWGIRSYGAAFPTKLLISRLHPLIHSREESSTQDLSKQVELNISSKKTTVMALDTTNKCPVQIEEEDLPHTGIFTYLGSIISRDGWIEPGHSEPSQLGQKLAERDEKGMALLHWQHSYRATEKDITIGEAIHIF